MWNRYIVVANVMRVVVTETHPQKNLSLGDGWNMNLSHTFISNQFRHDSGEGFNRRSMSSSFSCIVLKNRMSGFFSNSTILASNLEMRSSKSMTSWFSCCSIAWNVPFGLLPILSFVITDIQLNRRVVKHFTDDGTNHTPFSTPQDTAHVFR